MIGWTSVYSRDYAEALVNGCVDDDLDAMEAAIAARRDAIKFPACPACGEPLHTAHEHDGVRISFAPSMREEAENG